MVQALRWSKSRRRATRSSNQTPEVPPGPTTEPPRVAMFRLTLLDVSTLDEAERQAGRNPPHLHPSQWGIQCTIRVGDQAPCSRCHRPRPIRCVAPQLPRASGSALSIAALGALAQMGWGGLRPKWGGFTSNGVNRMRAPDEGSPST